MFIFGCLFTVLHSGMLSSHGRPSQQLLISCRSSNSSF